MEPGFESSPHSQAGWDLFTTHSVRHGITQAMGGQRLMGTREGVLILEAKGPKCRTGAVWHAQMNRDQEQGKNSSRDSRPGSGKTGKQNPKQTHSPEYGSDGGSKKCQRNTVVGGCAGRGAYAILSGQYTFPI